MLKTTHFIRVLAVVTVIAAMFAMSSCRTNDEDRLDEIYELIGDDAIITASCDLCELAGINDDDSESIGNDISLPVIVWSRTTPVVRDVLASVRGYKGLEMNHAITVAYSLDIPSDCFAVIMPVKDEEKLTSSLKARRFTHTDHDEYQVFRRKSTDGLAVVVYNKLAWFVFDDDVPTLIKNVKDLIARGSKTGLSQWKRDLLNSDNTMRVLCKHKVGNLDGEYGSFTLNVDGENFTAEGQILTADGKQTAFDKPENFRFIDPETVAQTCGDSFFTAAFAMPRSVDSRRIVESIIGNPEQADAETDSLRSTIRRIVDNVDGTMAFSIGMDGDDLLDLSEYDIDLVCKMAPGKSAYCLKSITNLLREWGITPMKSGASSVVYDLGDAQIIASTDENDLLTVRMATCQHDKIAPRKFDATNLIGFAIIDIPRNSQIASVMENDTRLQAQLRITPMGFILSASANEAASDFLTTIWSLLS